MAADSVDAWMRRMGTHCPPSAMFVRRRLAATEVAAAALAQPARPASAKYCAYVWQFSRVGDHSVPCIEDKDPAAGCLADRWAYGARSLHFILQDKAWHRTDLSLDDAAVCLAAVWSHPSVSSFVGRCGPESWLQGIPALYTTIKSKCWADSGRSCQKEGHSCVRRVCTWLHFPVRGALRRIGKAWRLCALAMGHGDGTASMAQSVCDLKSRVAGLEAPATPGTCSRPRLVESSST